jgi:hypothetical protein
MKFTLSICLVLITVLFVNCPSVAQTVVQSSEGGCVQKVSGFPALRGLKLNMTRSDVMKIYPLASANKPTNEIGETTLFVIKDQIVDDELKRNLKGITMVLMDDNLELISLIYDNSVKWGSLPKFVENLSGSLSIPVKYWESKSGGLYASAVCSDFILTAFLLGDEPSLLVQVKGYAEITQQRKRDIEEKKNKSFKP